MRDILHLAKKRKELKKIIDEKKIKINDKIVREDNLSMLLFDTLRIDEMKKYYRLVISENKKVALVEISEKERDAMKRAGKNIRRSFNKLKNSFQIRVVKDRK